MANEPASDPMRLIPVLSALAMAAAVWGGCNAEPPVGELQQSVLDERWWHNPGFPGSTPYNYADGHTWYDSDIGGGYVTGSYVRLPVDSNYIGDWNVGPVYCQGGGTSAFWAPLFEATVNGKTTRFVFNHLSQGFLGGKGWYNGGALVGLTGGGTCNTGFPTFSSGPHFCNEMRDYDPFGFWNSVPDYQSACTGSNGTSGVANPACPVNNNDPCSREFNGNGLYCGGTLMADVNTLFNCQNKVTASTMACPCGCTFIQGLNDACTACPPPMPDMAVASMPDLADTSKIDSGTGADLGKNIPPPATDGGKTATDGGKKLGSDAAPNPMMPSGVQGGCAVAGHTRAPWPLAAFFLLALARRRGRSRR